MQDPAEAERLSPGAEADRLRFFVFARVLLDLMPGPLAVLFTTHWDAKFPAHGPWHDGLESGRLFVDGLVALVCTGWLTAERGKREVVPSAELPLQRIDQIWIDPHTESFKVIVVRGQPMRLNICCPLQDGKHTARRGDGDVRARDPVTTRNAKPIGPHILKKLRTGEPQSWDLTAFNVALLGSSVDLLPKPTAALRSGKAGTAC